jgi:hypothetical protein
MNFTTKYDIGHQYWVARCRKNIHEEEKEIDGKIWVNTYFTFEPYVKQKEIVSIEVRHGSNGTGIIYGVRNVGEHAEMSFFYPENNILNYTKKEAQAIANKSAEDCEELY